MTRESRRLHASRVFLGLANSSNASDTGRPVLFGDFPGTITAGPVDSERGRG
jgi:hypothetical protein